MGYPQVVGTGRPHPLCVWSSLQLSGNEAFAPHCTLFSAHVCLPHWLSSLGLGSPGLCPLPLSRALAGVLTGICGPMDRLTVRVCRQLPPQIEICTYVTSSSALSMARWCLWAQRGRVASWLSARTPGFKSWPLELSPKPQFPEIRVVIAPTSQA